MVAVAVVTEVAAEAMVVEVVEVVAAAVMEVAAAAVVVMAAQVAAAGGADTVAIAAAMPAQAAERVVGMGLMMGPTMKPIMLWVRPTE